MQRLALTLVCALALAPSSRAFELEPDLWESARTSDLVAIARPVAFQRLRVSPACAWELVTCELERVLFARHAVHPLETAPLPRICVLRQLDSDEVPFQRQVLEAGRAYLFVLRDLTQVGCWAPLSAGHLIPAADPAAVRRMQQALFCEGDGEGGGGGDGERIDPAPLDAAAAEAHLLRVLDGLTERATALAARDDAALVALLASDELGAALYEPLRADRRVLGVEARGEWTLSANGQVARGALLPAWAPLAPSNGAEPRRALPALDGRAPLGERAATRFFRIGLDLNGLQETETLAGLRTIETARGPLTLQVHLKTGPGPVGQLTPGEDRRERWEGLPVQDWLRAACDRARAGVLARVLTDPAAEPLHELALAGLGDLASNGVPDALALLDEDPPVALRGLRALGRMGPGAREALGAIARVARGDEGLLRVQALTTLGELAVIDSASQAALEAGLRAPDERARQAAGRALASLGPAAAGAVPALTAALADPDPVVQAEAAAALGAIGPAASSAAPALRAKLTESAHPQVLRATSAALLAVGAPPADAIPALLARLQAGPATSDVWWPVCDALARYGPAAAEALPFLEAAARERPEPLRGFAARAARAIAGH